MIPLGVSNKLLGVHVYEEFDRQLFNETCVKLKHLGHGSILLIEGRRIFRYSFRPSVSLNETITNILHDSIGSNHVYYDLPDSNNLRLTWKEFVDRFIQTKTKRLLKHIRSLDET